MLNFQCQLTGSRVAAELLYDTEELCFCLRDLAHGMAGKRFDIQELRDYIEQYELQQVMRDLAYIIGSLADDNQGTG